MTNTNFKIGQTVNYLNGNPTIYQGIIVKVKTNTLIVIDDKSALELWAGGYSLGTEITFNQIK
jgi:hypothetical protein